MQNSVSVAMVIHNEEKHLEKCLLSIKNVTDDIVIIHDGECTDNSKNIALKFKAKFVERPFIGIAEGHRIASFDLTQRNWILVLDADEEISQELESSISELTSAIDVDAYEFIWPSFDGNKVVNKNWPMKKALFRKNMMKYIDFPQADIKTRGNLRKTNLVLHHFPTYNNFTFKSFNTKWMKWVDVQAIATLKNFNEFETIGYEEDEKNWSTFFLFKRRFPEFFLIYGFYEFYKSIISGLRSGGSIHALKSSFMWGAYNSFVYFKVMKIKWGI